MKSRVETWLGQDAWRMGALQAVATLDLPQGCLAAGFIRNLIWDQLHGHTQLTPLNDLDLVYYAPQARDAQRDLDLENQLQALFPAPWSVKNQARMHERNAHPPYTSVEEAMGYWPEKVTAVGVALNSAGQFRFYAPFGFGANFSLEVALNPHSTLAPSKVYARWRDKDWQGLWPKLRLIKN